MNNKFKTAFCLVISAAMIAFSVVRMKKLKGGSD